jgi:hypothetical protein
MMMSPATGVRVRGAAAGRAERERRNRVTLAVRRQRKNGGRESAMVKPGAALWIDVIAGLAN